jgi:hypothetical protein
VASGAPPVRILAVPARDDTDELLLEIFERTLDRSRFVTTSVGRPLGQSATA